ncbi:hypothetical protein TNCT_62871 [Trichonephila clavata]|uniref:Uncharacterized protein n=1 Tax=Trichonephila clavata TaxID=2740835 RepID=A0A8X6HBK4_TRICU|nr:hypothetical protein TNCT_62871 [Trichonephila clavata]
MKLSVYFRSLEDNETIVTKRLGAGTMGARIVAEGKVDIIFTTIRLNSSYEFIIGSARRSDDKKIPDVLKEGMIKRVVARKVIVPCLVKKLVSVVCGRYVAIR